MLAGKRRTFWFENVCVLLCLTTAQCQTIHDKVRLLEMAEVRGKSVSLEDLLPARVSPELREASAGMDICSAPQVGSSRVLHSEDIIRRISETDLLNQIAIPSKIVVRNSGWPINVESIRAALSGFLQQHGEDPRILEYSRIEFPPVGSSEQHPQLQVTSAARSERTRTLEVRLRCSERSLCGPFAASLTWGRSSAIGIAQVERDQLQTPPGPLMAKKTKPATLIMEAQNMRVSVAVTCLEEGRLGQRIRVRDSKTGRVFIAEVTGIQLLKANL